MCNRQQSGSLLAKTYSVWAEVNPSKAAALNTSSGDPTNELQRERREEEMSRLQEAGQSAYRDVMFSAALSLRAASVMLSMETELQERRNLNGSPDAGLHVQRLVTVRSGQATVCPTRQRMIRTSLWQGYIILESIYI